MAITPEKVGSIFQNETVVCIASGPSLTKEQVDYCRGKARTIAINRSSALAYWADVLYCCDVKMVDYLHGAPGFAGLKFTQDLTAAYKYGWQYIHSVDKPGLSTDPAVIHRGSNSGYQALNLALLMGAKRVLLLGYDMRTHGDKRHWHRDDGPNIIISPYQMFLDCFETIPEKQRSPVVNCTPNSALTTFRMAALQDVL